MSIDSSLNFLINIFRSSLSHMIKPNVAYIFFIVCDLLYEGLPRLITDFSKNKKTHIVLPNKI